MEEIKQELKDGLKEEIEYVKSAARRGELGTVPLGRDQILKEAGEVYTDEELLEFARQFEALAREIKEKKEIFHFRGEISRELLEWSKGFQRVIVTR